MSSQLLLSTTIGLFPSLVNNIDTSHCFEEHVDAVAIFPMLGISIRGMLRFIDDCGGRKHLEGLTTSDICRLIVKPMTSLSMTSYCDMQKEDIGIATIFVSHAWKYEFITVVDALMEYLDVDSSRIESTNTEYLWFDLFSNCQHDTGIIRPFEWWCGTFLNAIRCIGRLIIVLEPWIDPIPFHRVWCVWEIFCAYTSHCKIEVAMNRKQLTSFRNELISNCDAYLTVINNIDIRFSESTYPSDKDNIFSTISGTVGFHALNSSVLDCIRSWILADFASFVEIKQNQVDLSGIDKDEQQRMMLPARETLGKLLMVNGKTEEAKVLLQSCFQLRRDLYGEANMVIVDSLNQLVSVLIACGDYAHAIALYDRFLARLNQDEKNSHDGYWLALSYLGIAHERSGNYPEAENCFRSVVNYHKAMAKPNLPAIDIDITRLASICIRLGKFSDAEDMILGCLRQYTDHFSQHSLCDSSIITANNELASLCFALGKYPVAEKLFRQLLEIVRERFGSDHPDTLCTLNSLACTLFYRGCVTEAVELFHLCFLRRKAIMPQNREEIRSAANNFAVALCGAGDSISGEKVFRDDIFNKCICDINLDARFNDVGLSLIQQELIWRSNHAIMLLTNGIMQEAETILTSVCTISTQYSNLSSKADASFDATLQYQLALVLSANRKDFLAIPKLIACINYGKSLCNSIKGGGVAPQLPQDHLKSASLWISTTFSITDLITCQHALASLYLRNSKADLALSVIRDCFQALESNKNNIVSFNALLFISRILQSRCLMHGNLLVQSLEIVRAELRSIDNFILDNVFDCFQNARREPTLESIDHEHWMFDYCDELCVGREFNSCSARQPFDSFRCPDLDILSCKQIVLLEAADVMLRMGNKTGSRQTYELVLQLCDQHWFKTKSHLQGELANFSMKDFAMDRMGYNRSSMSCSVEDQQHFVSPAIKSNFINSWNRVSICCCSLVTWGDDLGASTQCDKQFKGYCSSPAAAVHQLDSIGGYRLFAFWHGKLTVVHESGVNDTIGSGCESFNDFKKVDEIKIDGVIPKPSSSSCLELAPCVCCAACVLSCICWSYLFLPNMTRDEMGYKIYPDSDC